ncbi:MAG: type II toxin-antitoxin system RelE/ParE family toxin [Candidatus Omnitrophota bacterium]|nr:type II toxin-antitoxin system RelE/ParE family toxin [Candidatus Omnitrophota bacterium]
MTYKVLLSPHAARDYKKLDPAIRPAIQTAIGSLQHHPLTGPKIKPLKGRLREYYRYRVGDYRIVYAVSLTERVVSIDYIQHRKDIYRER